MVRNKNYLICFVCFLILLFSPQFAQIKKTIIVKGKVFSNELDSKNMVIITKEELSDLKIKNFADLFSFFSVVNVSRRGSSESSFDISMRGSNFEQILLLVNSIPWNNPQTGHFNTDLPFLIKDIERVEIVRGGSSTTYGGGAFAGVINIILKKRSEFGLTFTSGGNKYFDTALNINKRLKNMDFKLSFNRSTTSGYYNGREIDQLKLTGGGSYSNKNLEIDFFSGFLNKKFGADGFYAPFPSYEKIKSFFYMFQLKKEIKKFSYSLTHSYNSHDDNFTLDRSKPDFFKNNSLTQLSNFNLSCFYKSNKIKTTGGIELKRETMDSSSMGIHERNRITCFANLNYHFGSSGIDAGIRGDVIIYDGKSNLTFYSGIYHNFSPNLVLKAGYGKSFRVPSFTELYYKSPANIGNPELEPEVSYNYETSLSIYNKNQSLDVTLFYRDQENVLDWVKYSASSPWEAVNISKNDVAGLEITHYINFDKTVIYSGFEKIFVINEQNGFLSKYGLRFPDLSLKVNLYHRISRALGFVANYYYKQIHKTDERGHFLNLIFSVYIKRVELSFRADNIFNTIIEEIPGVKIPGRWLYISISLK